MTHKVTEQYLDDFRDQDGREGITQAQFQIEEDAVRDFDLYVQQGGGKILSAEEWADIKSAVYAYIEDVEQTFEEFYPKQQGNFFFPDDGGWDPSESNARDRWERAKDEFEKLCKRVDWVPWGMHGEPRWDPPEEMFAGAEPAVHDV